MKSFSTLIRKQLAAQSQPTPSTIWASKPFRVLAALVFWVIIWIIAAKNIGLDLLLPGPISVIRALAEIVPTSEFWVSVVLTLVRTVIGFAMGTVLGVILGALTSISVIANTLISPLVRFMRTVPVASFIILALLLLRSDILPAFICCIVVLPVVWGNITTGIAATDTSYLELAAVYRLSFGKTLKAIYIPSVRPYFRAAVLSAIGMGWKSVVAAEVLCQPKFAIGSHVYYSKIYLETPQLFAWTLVVVLLSYGFEYAIRKASKGGRT